MLGETEFMNTYRPIHTGSCGQCMHDTLDEALTFAKSHGRDIYYVWTLIENDCDGQIYVAAGNHLVNRMGYIVTKVAWETGLEEGI